jgi:regulator of telomere elongation helicase 1
MRGKLSEGMDLPDKLARAIFIVGIPFLPINDPKVKIKK